MTTTLPDIPLLIRSENSSSERRISPSWTIAQLKARLEPITGVPASSQRLSLKVGSSSQPGQAIEAGDEDAVQLVHWPLSSYGEILVTDTRPPGLKENYTDVSRVAKYEMPAAEYARLPDSVLAWKKKQQLGRFDPHAPALTRQRVAASKQAIEDHGITVGARCRLLPADTDARRGEVAFLGVVPGIPGTEGLVWVGVRLDEPSGRNDGVVMGERYFEAKAGCGVFVKGERVEVGEFGVLDEFADEGEEAGEDDEF
ncbi:hypothetical protein LTR62_007728 [Meristemomyces frigidus]|uniref:CAP-Gly domain-containing protein n=1 Tax=Meristemomyces frigidus TaxID=1508187 RepID=A0AAN7TBP9_9PEZI|nr:hypothetical protein LTR62_007728 [Meristemomyces frigidus]